MTYLFLALAAGFVFAFIFIGLMFLYAACKVSSEATRQEEIAKQDEAVLASLED